MEANLKTLPANPRESARMFGGQPSSLFSFPIRSYGKMQSQEKTQAHYQIPGSTRRHPGAGALPGTMSQWLTGGFCHCDGSYSANERASLSKIGLESFSVVSVVFNSIWNPYPAGSFERSRAAGALAICLANPGM